MPIYDYECEACGKILTDVIAGINDCKIDCLECGGPKAAGRLITCGRGAYLGNQDADWLKSVREVVDKEGGSHCQEFLKNPTRDNYRNWMKGEGISPLEPGEKPSRKTGPSESQITKRLVAMKKKRDALEVRS